jgi:predicted permease
VRHVLRASGSESLEQQPGWAKVVYPAGIMLLIVIQVLLGFVGWDGALKFGNIFIALFASALTFGLFWGTRRFRIFNPVRAHWVTSAGSGINSLYQGLWSIYRGLARLGLAITDALEGEGGIMWTLLFLILFISIIVQGIQ